MNGACWGRDKTRHGQGAPIHAKKIIRWSFLSTLIAKDSSVPLTVSPGAILCLVLFLRGRFVGLNYGTGTML